MTLEGVAARGFAARTMAAQDARWIGDALFSTRGSVSGGGILPLVLLGHSSRIVYEGSAMLRSESPNVGVPQLSELLETQFAEVVARARHASKMLDDTKTSFTHFREEFENLYDTHRNEFTGNSWWFARWLESDIGLYRAGSGEILGNTITGSFRIGMTSDDTITDSGTRMFEAAREQGGALRVIASAAGDATPLSPTIDFGPLEPITGIDRRAVRYLKTRYDIALPFATKLILLMVEGEMNTTDLLLPLTAPGHEESVFRARMLSVFHSLRAIEEILIANVSAQSSSTMQVRAFLAEQTTQNLLRTVGARNVRNRCMHYEIRDPRLAIRPTSPMFGLVEALYPESSFHILDDALRTTTHRLARIMRQWRS